MTFKSRAVRGKCWKRARWSKRSWKILVKHDGPNTLIVVTIKSQWSLKFTCKKPIVEKPTLLLQVSVSLWLPPRPVAKEWVPPSAGRLGLDVAEGLAHLQQSPLSVLHALAGLAFLCAALCHCSTLENSTWNLLMPFVSVRSFISMPVLSYMHELYI